MNSWVFSRYADCEFILRTFSIFARDWRRVGQQVPPDRISIQNVDPPEHAGLHRLFMGSIRSQNVDELARKAAEDIVAGIPPTIPSEAMGALAVPFALRLMTDFLGVRAPGLSEFAAVSEAVMRAMDGGLRPAAAEAGIVARRELTELVDGWYREGGDPSRALGYIQRTLAEMAPGKLDPQFVRNTARVMFQGGYSTLVAAIGNFVHLITSRGELQEQLRTMPRAALLRAVDETLRYDGPVQGTTRVATRSVTVNGQVVAPGENALCLIAAANRDGDRFEHPDDLMLDRTENRHMAFGWGPHACIASGLARSALTELAAVLLADGRRVVAAGQPVRRDTATLRAMDRLPVRLLPVRTEVLR
ncbi:cytochrome P450 [Actinoplanes sp. N902-109]|uniref:cytochrome P450 n=1 Tax=Actinoplanes sp. (strain N902-109) TaxID=649831 RepID=UPI0018DB1D17|nr:cytochrome P450 [Actinoplanes sp. N902-109]